MFRNFGMQIYKFTKSHTILQQQMKHYIKIASGISKGYIQHNRKYQRAVRDGSIAILTGIIGGVSQGGGASPLIWLSVLLVLFQAYKMTQHGAELTDYVTNLYVPMWVTSYVDDNTIVRTFSRTCSMRTMIQQLKINLNEWHKLLQLTGGS